MNMNEQLHTTLQAAVPTLRLLVGEIVDWDTEEADADDLYWALIRLITRLDTILQQAEMEKAAETKF